VCHGWDLEPETCFFDFARHRACAVASIMIVIMIIVIVRSTQCPPGGPCGRPRAVASSLKQPFSQNVQLEPAAPGRWSSLGACQWATVGGSPGPGPAAPGPTASGSLSLSPSPRRLALAVPNLQCWHWQPRVVLEPGRPGGPAICFAAPQPQAPAVTRPGGRSPGPQAGAGAWLV
jgi:hypothetical protein